MKISIEFRPRATRIAGSPTDIATLLMLASQGAATLAKGYPNGDTLNNLYSEYSDYLNEESDKLEKAAVVYLQDRI